MRGGFFYYKLEGIEAEQAPPVAEKPTRRPRQRAQGSLLGQVDALEEMPLGCY